MEALVVLHNPDEGGALKIFSHWASHSLGPALLTPGTVLPNPELTLSYAPQGVKSQHHPFVKLTVSPSFRPAKREILTRLLERAVHQRPGAVGLRKYSLTRSWQTRE